MDGILSDARMKEKGFISDVWYLGSKEWAFQKIGKCYRLYDSNGDFCQEFKSFRAMTDFISGRKD